MDKPLMLSASENVCGAIVREISGGHNLEGGDRGIRPVTHLSMRQERSTGAQGLLN